MDDSWRRPHDHDFGRNRDPIWDGSSIDSDHADAEHSTSAPSLQGKKVDDSDFFRALDHADLRLLEASQLVDGISRQSDQAASTDSFDSCRPTRVITHELLGTSLTITSTPTGRSVKPKTAPDQIPPFGLNNSADHYSRHTQSLFNRAGWSPRQSSRVARHYVNMVSIDIWERNKELIRKRTDIGEHFTRKIIQSIVFIFLPLGERVHLTNLVYYY